MDFATCKEKLTDQIKENDRLCKIIRIKKQESLSIEKELIALREENERLREALKEIDALLVSGKIDDCENGVKSLNEKAAFSYLHDYRHTKYAIDQSIKIARSALQQKDSE